MGIWTSLFYQARMLKALRLNLVVPVSNSTQLYELISGEKTPTNVGSFKSATFFKLAMNRGYYHMIKPRLSLSKYWAGVEAGFDFSFQLAWLGRWLDGLMRRTRRAATQIFPSSISKRTTISAECISHHETPLFVVAFSCSRGSGYSSLSAIIHRPLHFQRHQYCLWPKIF